MIKTKLIKTAKATILVVGGLPEDTGYVNLLLGDLFYAKDEGDWNLYMEKGIIPPGKWQSVGFLDKIPEREAMKLVEDCPFFAKCWKRYGDKKGMNKTCWTPTESLRSLVEANCPDFTNPFILKNDTD